MLLVPGRPSGPPYLHSVYGSSFFFFYNFEINLVYPFICKVAFKNFYNTKSAGDKCTLYSDRNLINRRNVRENVDAAVNPC